MGGFIGSYIEDVKKNLESLINEKAKELKQILFDKVFKNVLIKDIDFWKEYFPRWLVKNLSKDVYNLMYRLGRVGIYSNSQHEDRHDRDLFFYEGSLYRATILGKVSVPVDVIQAGDLEISDIREEEIGLILELLDKAYVHRDTNVLLLPSGFFVFECKVLDPYSFKTVDKIEKVIEAVSLEEAIDKFKESVPDSFTYLCLFKIAFNNKWHDLKLKSGSDEIKKIETHKLPMVTLSL